METKQFNKKTKGHNMRILDMLDIRSESFIKDFKGEKFIKFNS